MEEFYERFIDRENEIYLGMAPVRPANGRIGPPELDAGLDWLCEGAETVLDFGCGSGALLFACAFRGVKQALGIDLAEAAIGLARRQGKDLPQCQFQIGSVELLEALPAASFGGVILSNILDNLRSEDALAVLTQVHRLLRPEGRALIKLNPYLTPEQIDQWGVKIIEKDLLDDGLLLWNRETKAWEETLTQYFLSVRLSDLYFPEYDQHNRMFLCEKTK